MCPSSSWSGARGAGARGCRRPGLPSPHPPPHSPALSWPEVLSRPNVLFLEVSLLHPPLPPPTRETTAPTEEQRVLGSAAADPVCGLNGATIGSWSRDPGRERPGAGQRLCWSVYRSPSQAPPALLPWAELLDLFSFDSTNSKPGMSKASGWDPFADTSEMV